MPDSNSEPGAALAGRRALVTGSSAGIGYAIAQALAAAGAEVVLNGRHRTALDAAAQRLRAAVPGASVHAVEADLAAAPGAHALVQAAGPIDLLINNLGIFEQRAFEAIDDAAWTRLFETNVMSGVRLSRALLPAMRARGFGRIVFVSSESGVSPPADMVHYGVTKAAQIALARGLAEACGDCGVTVNSVLPGPTLTEGAAAYFEAAAQRAGITVEQAHRDFFAHARPTSLIRRFIEPAEVAALVAHVCSPLGGAIHGAALRVEGGVVRSMI
jgi:NAD(P)-dependent dehydrogenase (short-subunit alcohol dehydrogenase family)